jgi:crotonobetainyl-CoA:carnitine CoA-transferase CaiB-like acyl-CoA transferase
MSRTPCEEFVSPPTLGEHTLEVLRDVLKYSAEKIEAFEISSSNKTREKERTA